MRRHVSASRQVSEMPTNQTSELSVSWPDS